MSAGVVGKNIGILEDCLINANTQWAELNIADGGTLQNVAYSGLASDLSGSLPASSLPSATVNPLALKGVIDASDASAGFVGEVVSGVVLFASAVNLANSGVAENIVNISLPAGDWDVESNLFFQGAANLVSATSSTSLNTGTLDNQAFRAVIESSSLHSQAGLSTVSRRVNVDVQTTVYLVASAVFSVGTVSVCGTLQARRIR